MPPTSLTLQRHSAVIKGFTLIEISIVLVIIGLVVGGVLVGRDLISAAEIRKQISQIERFQVATNTFRGKYGGLPGDLEQAAASQFGFITRGTYQGQGDGNGLLEGISSSAGPNMNGGGYLTAENIIFWVDLSQTGLIEDKLNLATTYSSSGYSSSLVPRLHPVAKLGTTGANPSVYVHSAGGRNYFGLSGIGTVSSGVPVFTNILTVAQAKTIDSKIDDGHAWTGKVLALLRYANETNLYQMSFTGISPSQAFFATDLSADYSSYGLNSTSSSCIDNAGQTIVTPEYTSLTVSILPACSLSFAIQ